jgi:hypothetical protein
MSSPVKLYHEEMHRQVGYFATWLPNSAMALGDIGVLEAGRFRRVASLKELGLKIPEVREGAANNMSYSASAKRSAGASAKASSRPLAAKAKISIQFTGQGGFVFEAVGIRHLEIADRLALANNMLQAFKAGRWQKDWVLVEGVYRASSATIIVSEDSSAQIELTAKAKVALDTLPLADPKLGLSVSSQSGKLFHVVAKDKIHPLYSCVRVNEPFLFGKPSVQPVRGLGDEGNIEALSRPGISDLINS